MLFKVMHALLNDKHDTAESLEKQVQEFRRARDEAAPSFHATTHVADRVLQVMERKLEMLEQVQNKVEAFQLARKDVETTLRRAMEGADMRDESYGANGLRSLMRECVGECPDLDEKVDWPQFLRNIRLPSRHACVTGVKKVLEEGEEEWGVIGALLCLEQADTVLLPKHIRQKRAQDRKVKRIFMKSFPECKQGVTAAQVEVVLENVQRIFFAARSFGNLREKSPQFQEMSEIEQDLRCQVFILRSGSGGEEGVKIKR